RGAGGSQQGGEILWGYLRRTRLARFFGSVFFVLGVILVLIVLGVILVLIVLGIVRGIVLWGFSCGIFRLEVGIEKRKACVLCGFIGGPTGGLRGGDQG